MFFKIKQGDILAEPTNIEDAKFLVSYEREGGSPLFAIIEHAGSVALSTPEDSNFKEILRLSGVE